jgi:hypothetical protein
MGEYSPQYEIGISRYQERPWAKTSPRSSSRTAATARRCARRCGACRSSMIPTPPTIREPSEALGWINHHRPEPAAAWARRGLISPVQDEADRRSCRVKITKAGRSRLADARPLWSVAQQRFEDGFGKRAAAELRSILVNIARGQSLAVEGDLSPSKWRARSIHPEIPV